MAKQRQQQISRRQEASDQRRQAVLDAGLTEFAARGFAAARLDDVAQKAGVAKGTIYLFFKDKEDLFEQIVIGAAAPVLNHVKDLASRVDIPADVVLSSIFELFRREILGTQRREIIRLVLTEGQRFPRIAEFYHREVIAKAMALLRQLAQRARARGELPTDVIERFPQLVMAPLLLALLWDGLFSALEPLDIEGMLRAHHDLLTGRRSDP